MKRKKDGKEIYIMIEIESEIQGGVQKGRNFLGFLIKIIAKMERGTILYQSSLGALSSFPFFFYTKFEEPNIEANLFFNHYYFRFVFKIQSKKY